MSDSQTTPTNPLMENTIDAFWENFPFFWHTVRARIHSEANQAHQITVGQFHILRRIRAGIQTVSELATAKHISRPAISRAVDELVEKGYISRQPSTTDRRKIELILTEMGAAHMNAISKTVRQWMAEELATLDDHELEAIIQAMQALRKAFE